jgi:hypothetical protein
MPKQPKPNSTPGKKVAGANDQSQAGPEVSTPNSSVLASVV